jgi:DNA-binding PadR family transcriptional regulator
MITRARRRSPGRPDRLVYDITSKGRDTLAEWLSSATPLAAPRDAFSLQLYFSAGQHDGVLERVLAERRSLHQTRLDELRRRSDGMADRSSLPDRTMVIRQTAFDGAMARERATIDWLDDCLEALRSGALPATAEKARQEHLSGA